MGLRFWVLPPGVTAHVILSPGRGVYVVFHFWVSVTMAVLACSLGHTPLASWFPGSWRARGARGQELAGLVAATNLGKSWRSLGLKSPSGYWRVGVRGRIQHSVHWGGGGYAGCEGRCLSGSAYGASRVGAGSIPVAVSRRTRPPIGPFKYRWRRALLQVCGATIRFAFFGGVGGSLKKRRDLHPICRYRRWRVLTYGWVVPTMPTRELYVQGNQGHSPGIEPPLWTTEDYRSLCWAVYVSYLLSSSDTWEGEFRGWVGTLRAVRAAGQCFIVLGGRR